MEDTPAARFKRLPKDDVLFLERLFSEFDVDESGGLGREQTGALIRRLNDGVAPTDEELDDVMREAAGPAHATGDGDNDEVVAQIVELLDTRVRPAVAMDGGDIVFHGFEDGVVFLTMQGACAGCPSSTATLKMGIENLLRHYIPEVEEVQAVA